MKVKEFFTSHPIFRYGEFAAFMTSLGTKLTIADTKNHQAHVLPYLISCIICYFPANNYPQQILSSLVMVKPAILLSRVKSWKK